MKIHTTTQITVLAFLSAGAPSHAQLEVFFDRGAFEAAATQPVFTEDCEQYRSDVLLDRTTLPMIGGAVQVSSESSRNIAIRLDTPPNQSGRYGIDDSGFGQSFIYSEINVSGPGLLRLDLPELAGREHRIGFDFSGAGGSPPPDASGPFLVSCRITTEDGRVTDAKLPDDDGDGHSNDDGFIGFYDSKSPIISVELLTFDSPFPEGHFRYYQGQIYAIDNITTTLPDQDGDGLPDHYEDDHGLDRTQPDADSDADGDGLSALVEFARHTNPQRADTDSDGVDDGAETGDPTDRNDPNAFDLRIDFGALLSTEGYQNYDPSNLVEGEWGSQTYDAFATEITLRPEFPDTDSAPTGSMILRDNPDFDYWDNVLYDGSIARDSLIVDTQTSNGGNGDYDGDDGSPTRLALRLGRLPAGTYAWTSFHHDLYFHHTEFITEISIDGGATFSETGRHRMTHGRDGGNPSSDDTRDGPVLELMPSTVDVSFEADGEHDVVFRFTPLAADGPDTRVFGINGFHLIQTAAAIPPLEITKVSIDSDSGMITLTWRSYPGRLYLIETSSDLASWIEAEDSIDAAVGESKTTFSFAIEDDTMPRALFFQVREQGNDSMP